MLDEKGKAILKQVLIKIGAEKKDTPEEIIKYAKELYELYKKELDNI